jgi:hypothetical protein
MLPLDRRAGRLQIRRSQDASTRCFVCVNREPTRISACSEPFRRASPPNLKGRGHVMQRAAGLKIMSFLCLIGEFWPQYVLTMIKKRLRIGFVIHHATGKIHGIGVASGDRFPTRCGRIQAFIINPGVGDSSAATLCVSSA